MKKEFMVWVARGVVVAAALTLILILGLPPTTLATNTSGRDITDHALVSTFSDPEDVAGGCKSDKSFTFYITAQAYTSPATLNVIFVNDTTNTADDQFGLTVPTNQVVTITQAAGGTPNVDTHLVVELIKGTGGEAHAWISLMTQSGATGFDNSDVDYCRSYNTTVAAALADD